VVVKMRSVFVRPCRHSFEVAVGFAIAREKYKHSNAKRDIARDMMLARNDSESWKEAGVGKVDCSDIVEP